MTLGEAIEGTDPWSDVTWNNNSTFDASASNNVFASTTSRTPSRGAAPSPLSSRGSHRRTASASPSLYSSSNNNQQQQIDIFDFSFDPSSSAQLSRQAATPTPASQAPSLFDQSSFLLGTAISGTTDHESLLQHSHRQTPTQPVIQEHSPSLSSPQHRMSAATTGVSSSKASGLNTSLLNSSLLNSSLNTSLGTPSHHSGSSSPPLSPARTHHSNSIASTAVTNTTTTVRVSIHEQVAALYDEITEDPICQVEGSLSVSTTSNNNNTPNTNNNNKLGTSNPLSSSLPYYLVVRDLEGHVRHWQEFPDVCQDVSHQASRKGLHRTDKVWKVFPPTEDRLTASTLVAQYICTDRVRPVPLLIKSRVVTNAQYCRVGFKVRANPSNPLPLTRVVLLLAVPPHVEGRTAKMSRKGGVWDELKRTISWVLPALQPGEALEIQAQFAGLEHAAHHIHEEKDLRFPILARADYGATFSSLEIRKSETRDAGTQPVQHIHVHRSGRVLHRKV